MSCDIYIIMLREILNNFEINENIYDVKKYGNGHINETYLVEGENHKYILQNLNTKVFKDYEGVMNNISLVTDFINKKLISEFGYLPNTAIKFIPCKDGKLFFLQGENCYRVMNLVENSVVYQQTEDKNILEEAGKCLGEFIYRLEDFDASKLCEVIPNFHNTKKRFEDFKCALKNDVKKRCSSIKDEIQFILDRENMLSKIIDAIENNEIPLRVTHNDTKLNNMLFDRKTNKAICLIDLDTIMPGSLLFDFGDAIRVACSTSIEEEKDLSKVRFNLLSYEAFLKGFLCALKNTITEKEVSMLHIGAKIMTFEVGMRFLEDYINGDKYFKIKNEDDNLIRAKTQIKMTQEIEKYENKMEEIARKYYNI